MLNFITMGPLMRNLITMQHLVLHSTTMGSVIRNLITKGRLMLNIMTMGPLLHNFITMGQLRHRAIGNHIWRTMKLKRKNYVEQSFPSGLSALTAGGYF